ncbi:kp4 domain-containing protein [Penicillium lividum]|nr:kp4 domain-containing protein [Penicillium lividum]
MKLTILGSAIALVASTSARGIHCGGSGLCHTDNAAGNLRNLHEIINNIEPRYRHYKTGEQIACTGSLCAFYAHGASGTADEASSYVQALLNYHCLKCGAVPTNPGNDVTKGSLTVNIVGIPQCQGAC